MAGNADFINILREIRGSAAPGQPLNDGIWYELTIADKNGNPGVYGDILAKYGIVTESAGTFDQAVAILENLNVDVTTLPAGAQATSALVNGVWQIGIPIGTAGIDGIDGFTPVVAMNYSLGNLNYTVTVDGIQVTNNAIVDLDGLIDTVVDANVAVQTTLAAKQEVLDAVADAQAIADELDANAANKIVELDTHTAIKVGELNVASAAEQSEIAAAADAKKLEYNQNVVVKTAQYNTNHTTKLNEYNANDALKIEQYNANHLERLENLDTQYADRIVDMLNTNKILGMVDKFAAKTPTEYAMFIDTVNGNYLYYLNGVLLPALVGYTVLNDTTIQLATPIEYGDVVTQVDSRYVGDYLEHEGVVLEERIGQPNGVAGLDDSGKVPAVQLPSYVDDVIEVATYASLPTIGEVSKIYVVFADENNGGDTSSYRWAGSVYAMVSNTLTAADIKALYESVYNKVLSSVNSLQFTGGTGTQGTMTWNADEETVDLVQNGATLQMGQELQTHVRNGTASTIANGRVVMATGTIGASGRIVAGLYNGASAVKYILGVTTEDVIAGDDGKVTHFGKVRGINTSAWNEYDLLYPTANGLFTNVAPTTGVRVALAMVITKHAVNGIIMVRANGVDELAYEPKNTNIQTHIASTSNPHSVTKAQVGLGNVDNTSDANKPISTAAATEFALKAPLASPALTGSPTAPTAVVGTSTTQLATTAFVNAEIANDTYLKGTLDTNGTIMSKAAFNALAAERRANRAGSGFDSFGKYFSILGNMPINSGMWVSNTLSNAMYLGVEGSASVTGTESTQLPYAVINGVSSLISGVNKQSDARTNEIKLPPAPTVLPYDATLTTEQIAMGVIKHADSSNSGLIVNGKFDTDTSGWTAYSTDTAALAVAGEMKLTSTIGYARNGQIFNTVIGKKYVIEFEAYRGTSTSVFLYAGTMLNNNSLGSVTITSTTKSRYTLEFVATTGTTVITVRTNETDVGTTGYFDNIAVFPSDAISRSDLCLLESWHEDVSEKDFVYPLGNVQYLGTTGDSGTPVVGAFAGSGTYSLFGNWQASGALVGKGYVWSTLSDANKKAFVANPENNCYLDGDKVIQVRYRVRVQLGEDTWTMSKATVQGKAITPSTTLFTAPITTVDAGLCSNTSTTYTYTGTTTGAIEVCKVSR